MLLFVVCDALRLNPNELETLKAAALLHDIGNPAIAKPIVSRAGPKLRTSYLVNNAVDDSEGQ